MSEQEILIKEAKRAIDKVFGDTLVDRITTKESLEELKEYVEIMLDTLTT